MSPMPRRKVWLVVVANGPINLPETSTSNRIERLPQTEQNRNAMPLPLPETSGEGRSCELGMKIGRITMEVEAEKRRRLEEKDEPPRTQIRAASPLPEHHLPADSSREPASRNLPFHRIHV